LVRKSAKEGRQRTKEEEQFLASHPKIFDEVLKNLNKRQLEEDRKKEVEDSPTKLAKKCAQLSKAIQKAKYLVVYTGAGISTAANIPGILSIKTSWNSPQLYDCALEP
jgi:NAD+-dependent protein deacetylase sirtuin 7